MDREAAGWRLYLFDAEETFHRAVDAQLPDPLIRAAETIYQARLQAFNAYMDARARRRARQEGN